MSKITATAYGISIAVLISACSLLYLRVSPYLDLSITNKELEQIIDIGVPPAAIPIFHFCGYVLITLGLVLLADQLFDKGILRAIFNFLVSAHLVLGVLIGAVISTIIIDLTTNFQGSLIVLLAGLYIVWVLAMSYIDEKIDWPEDKP